MTNAKIEPDRILTNFLRTNLTDPNASRSGNWIYPDFPRVASLGDTSFPRVGITVLTESSDYLAINDNNQYHSITFQIDVVTKKDLIVTRTVTDEAMGSVGSGINSNRLTYDFIPTSVTNIKHAGTGYGTVTNKGTNALFTSPAGMAGDVIEWSTSTGDLNLNATDVTADDGEAITSTYTIAMEGKKCVQHVAREIIKELRNNWRTDTTLNGLMYPEFISNNPIPIDEELGIYRQTLEISFKAINIGEGL
jgi:hypothetical protein